MKIGYIRFNQNMDIDWLHAGVTNLGTDFRLPILEAFVRAGHTVTIYTAIKEEQLHVLSGIGDGFDYGFMKSVKYDPSGFPTHDDILFIETSATNPTYMWKAPNGDKIPYMVRAANVLRNYSGKVIVFHHSNVILGFPFGDIFRGPVDSISPNSIPNILRDINFANYEWHLWATCLNKDTFLDQMKINRYSYLQLVTENLVKLHLVPYGYSDNFNRYKQPVENPATDLLYIGKKKSKRRTDKLFKYLADTGLEVAVIGKWTGTPDVCEARLTERRAEIYKGEYRGIMFLGPMGGQAEGLDYYNATRAALQIGDSEFERWGMLTYRLIETIRSGALLFCDEDIWGMKDFLGEFWCVGSQEELIGKLTWVKALSHTEICELACEQNSRLTRWSKIIANPENYK